MVFLHHKELANLVRKAKDGDTSAFSQIYEHTADFQYYRLMQTLQNPHDAQDALQETYLLLYQNLEKIEHPSCIVSYLNRLSYFVGKNMIRRKDTLNRRVVSMDTVLKLSDPASQVEETVEKKENGELIRQALSELDEQERLVLLLRNYEKQTLKQTAYILGISLTTVKRIQKNAQTHLRELLKKQGTHYFLGGPMVFRAVRETLRSQNIPGMDITPEELAPYTKKPVPKPPNLLLNSGIRLALRLSVTLAALGSCAAAAAISIPKPVIQEIIFPSQYSRGPISVHITVKSPVTLKDAALTDSKGRYHPLTAAGNGVFTTSLAENGTYRFYISSLTGKSTFRNFTVNSIDTIPPKAVSCKSQNRQYKIFFEDKETGMDYSSIYCESESGMVTLPNEYNAEKGFAVFYLSDENHMLNFADLAGNTCSITLKYIENPDKGK